MQRKNAPPDPRPRTLDRLIPQPELLRDYVPLDRSTIWRLVKAEKFPAPIRIGDRRLAWRESDVQRWIDEKASA